MADVANLVSNDAHPQPGNELDRFVTAHATGSLISGIYAR